MAVVPHFPGLRRFPQGRGFKQWTGDDSKALMKASAVTNSSRSHLAVLHRVCLPNFQVYLGAITGYVPPRMVQALSAFLEFCYLVRRDTITTNTLAEIEDALTRFHRDRVIFEEAGVRLDGFSLPRQHSLVHYLRLIQMYGAPNGLCSSITESKHIQAVKEPWRRSNRFEALGQMLLTNQRLDKLAAARVDFSARGMLQGPYTAAVPRDDDDDLEGDVWDDLGLDGAPSLEELDALAERQAALEEDDDGGPVDDLEIMGSVALCKRKGESAWHSHLYATTNTLQRAASLAKSRICLGL